MVLSDRARAQTPGLHHCFGALSNKRSDLASCSSLDRSCPERRSGAARPISERNAASHSVQVIGIALDVLGKAERVIAHQLFRAVGRTRFKCFDDVHMITDRAIHPK